VVKHVGVVELRVVVAAVLAVAADALLVAQHLLKLGAHLVTALARLHVHNLTRRSSLEAGKKRVIKGGEERRTSRNSRVAVWHGKQKMPVARARVSRTGKLSGFTTPTSRASGTVQSALGVGGCGREIFASATCQLQFAKASAATLPQQEMNESEDVQQEE
jgi:hypothetical protein